MPIIIRIVNTHIKLAIFCFVHGETSMAQQATDCTAMLRIKSDTNTRIKDYFMLLNGKRMAQAIYNFLGTLNYFCLIMVRQYNNKFITT